MRNFIDVKFDRTIILQIINRAPITDELISRDEREN